MFIDLVQKAGIVPSQEAQSALSEPEIKQGIVHCKDLTEAKMHWNKKKMAILQDYSLEPGIMKEIAGKGRLCVAIPVAQVIRSRGITRTLLIRSLRNFISYGVKTGLECRIVSYAATTDELRSERELVHLGCLLGLTVSQAKKMVGLPEFMQKAENDE